MPAAGLRSGVEIPDGSDYFYSEFGPTTVERHDPMFVLKGPDAVVSGQSWPVRDDLKRSRPMANVTANLRSGPRQPSDDYTAVAHNYASRIAKTGDLHRRGPQTRSPIVAGPRSDETASEQYLHSGFRCLVITGLLDCVSGDGNGRSSSIRGALIGGLFRDRLTCLIRTNRVAIRWERRNGVV